MESSGHYRVQVWLSIALAVLEILVHSPLELPDGYELWKVEIPPRCTKVVELPREWRDDAAGAQEFGDRWLAESAVVQVPSVVIPLESKYILKPRHPEYPAGHWTPMGTFDFDYRLRPQLKAFVTHEG